ncbi:hypothetical protein [Rhizobium sp. G21]|uniref:hypothetical protein n=1 Tax=Rhizobium sp. G21 TaxID=2758439 RepID=UPI001602486D|nr:hypothetical protein [Rhizobium sp. G21]MBB1247437.1 hypothetical protein [Rhizobium sp. G21]
MRISRRAFLASSAAAIVAPALPAVAEPAAAMVSTSLWAVGDPDRGDFVFIVAKTELCALHSWARYCRIDFTKLPANLTPFVKLVKAGWWEVTE